MIRGQCSRAVRSSSPSPPFLAAQVRRVRAARRGAGVRVVHARAFRRVERAPCAERRGLEVLRAHRRAHARHGRRPLSVRGTVRLRSHVRGARERGQAARERRGPRRIGAHGRRETVGATKRGRARARRWTRCTRSARGRRARRFRRHARRTGSVGAAARSSSRLSSAMRRCTGVRACRTSPRSRARVPRARTSCTGQATARACRARTARASAHWRARRVVRVEERAAPAFLAHRERRTRARRGRVDGGGTRPEPAAAADWVLADGVARTAHGQPPAGGQHRASAIGPRAVRAYGTASRSHSRREGCGRGCVVLCEGVGARTSPQLPPLGRERETLGGVGIVTFKSVFLHRSNSV
jgi:hypothetical protein